MQSLELAVFPLDVARRTTLRLASRSALLTRVLGRRDSRIAVMATVQVALLFALALRAPVALFFLGPVLLGVVHLAADVRYLALRRAPPRALLVGSVAVAVAITIARAAVAFRYLSAGRGDQLDVTLGMAWIALALVLALRGRSLRFGVAAPIFLLAAGCLVSHARVVELALVHLHNVVALAAWLLLFRRRAGWSTLPLVLVVGFAAVLLSGAFVPWTLHHGGLVAFGIRAERLGAWLAPGVRPGVGVALAGTFVFLQGVHYATWTGWIPQDDLHGEGTPTFRMSVRGLTRDFGPLALGLIVCAALALAAAAILDMQRAVSWYMTLAKSHGWFELAFLTFFVASGARSRAPAP